MDKGKENQNILSNSRKLLLSVISGVLCFSLSSFGIQITWETVTINLPWSILFPIIVSMVYGWRYGLIAGLSGGALFPFYLWFNNGYPNLTTAILYLCFYILLGFTFNQRVLPQIKSPTLRISLVFVLCIIVFYTYYKLIFNYLLSLNPPFWNSSCINNLSPEILNGFFIKDSLNFLAFSLISNTLIRVQFIRKFLGLNISSEMKNNGLIFLYSMLVALLVWASYVLLGNSLLKGENSLSYESIILALLVLITSGLIVARVIINYNEAQVKNSYELIENEKKYKSLSESSKDYIMRFDKNFKHLYINQITFDLLQAKPEQLLLKTHKESGLFPIEQCDFWEQNIKKVFETKEIVQLQFDFYNGNKTVYFDWMLIPEENDMGEVENVLSISRDITNIKQYEIELKAAKEKAEENEVRYRGLLTNIETGVVVHAKDTSIILCNSRSSVLLGLSEEQMKGKVAIDPYWKFIYEDNTPIPLSDYPVMQIINGKKSIRNQILGVCRTSNDIVWIMVNGFTVMKDNTEISEIIISFIDVTERILAEQELRKAKEKAEESDRLKTAFLQNMSHEIRTPMNAICGFSSFLGNPDLSMEKRNNFVSIIQNSSNQLLSIVTDILTISSLETKQEKANIDKVCINNIIVDLLSIFKQQAINKNISLYTIQPLSDKQSEVFTDRTKITQIFTNLLTNALKFTQKGFIEFGYNLKENQLEFYIKDSGIGIESQFHETIFERFRQADKSINKLYGGTGLGLAISKAFAELLGGKIWVQSELEKGSTFYFTIPYNPVNEFFKTKTPIKQSENFRTVLVAEDEEYNFLFIRELLNDMDLTIIRAKDGKETVEIFKSNPNIDLILMDIKMPIMTGHEAAKIIKELKPDLPIVAQTAYALEHERAKYVGIFDNYLAKPINKDDLNKVVMEYININKK